jgi:hydroxymethylpyrimidine pyrophosphatase-like HAD family hydrolase
MVGTAQEDQENEHSEERLNDFSQEAEEVVVLELTAEEEAEEELEQTLKSSHAEMEEENEHSVECLNIFSQGAEKKEAIALKLAAKEVEERAT